MSSIRNMSIGIKLLFFVVIAVILTITILVSSALLQFRYFNDNASKDEAVKGMEALHSLIESYKENSLKFATIMSLNNDVINAVEQRDINSISDTINLITNEANLDFVIVTDNDGHVLASTHKLEEQGESLAIEPNIQRAIKGSSFTTVEAEIIGNLSASSVVPIKDKTGKIIGSILTGIMLDKHEILDDLKQIHKTDVTIFLGDVRINTTVEQNGNRLVGTKLDSKIADKVLNKKETYIGNAEILGVPYICAYIH